MYSYKKDKKFKKKRLLAVVSCLFIGAVGYFSYEYSLQSKPKDTAVFKDQSVPVLTLPNAAIEKAIKPFTVEAQTVLEYFDGKESEIENMTKFEGVYRANQGMDYAFNEEAFEVVAVFSGDVSDVKEDAVFGKSVSITSGDLTITYQSISDITVKKGDKVNQSDVIAKSGTNIYNKDLGSHLHIVVEKGGKIMDPKGIYDKALSEIK